MADVKDLRSRKIAVLLFILGIFALLWFLGLQDLLTLNSLKQNLGSLQNQVATSPFITALVYFSIYLILTAISFPGATLLTLLAGALFGVWIGTILVSLASTLGATLAFLFSRYLFRDNVQKRFQNQLKAINDGLRNEGAYYLLSLRLIPVFPFFVVNLVMGLTAISIRRYFVLSQIGMLPGTVIYVYAGLELSQITELSQLLSPAILGILILLGLLPILFKVMKTRLLHFQIYRPFKKPKRFDYNLVVIGGGAAGLVTSYIASAVKAKVALIEKNKMGGDCLYTGCVPSKTLIQTARFIHDLKNGPSFGVRSIQHEYHFADIMNRIQTTIQQIEPHDSVVRYTQLGVDCLQGEAVILSPYEVRLNGKTISTKNIVIATGASPYVPDIPGLKSAPHYTSENLWSIQSLPPRLLVLGGGAIGCELSQAFAMLGSEVTLIESHTSILHREDSDVREVIEKEFVKLKIKVIKEALLKEVIQLNKESVAIIQTKQDDLFINFDAVLLATGRKAHTVGFGLENLNISLNQDGTIKVDPFLRTDFPNIFACGDVAGPFQFTHAAGHQAWHASVNALFSPFKKFAVDYRFLPWSLFTTPEIARVGLNETQAQSQNLDFIVSRFQFSELDRALIDGKTEGFIKVITKKGSDRILGVTIIGAEAGQLLPEFVLAMKHGLGLNKILGTIHAYPTVTEANKYVAGIWKKQTAPHKILNILEKFHRFRRH